MTVIYAYSEARSLDMLSSKVRIEFHMEVHVTLWYFNNIDPDDSDTVDFHDRSPGGCNLG